MDGQIDRQTKDGIKMTKDGQTDRQTKDGIKMTKDGWQITLLRQWTFHLFCGQNKMIFYLFNN